MIIYSKTKDGTQHALRLSEANVSFMEMIMEEGYNTLLRLNGKVPPLNSPLMRRYQVVHRPAVLAFAKAEAEIIRGNNRSREAVIRYPHAYVLFGGEPVRWAFGKFRYDSATGDYLIFE